MIPEDAERIIGAILDASDPGRAVRQSWPSSMETREPVVLIAAGKGSAAMVEASLERVSDRVRLGAVACVPAHEDRVREVIASAGLEGRVTVWPADHPLATERNVLASEAIAEAAHAARLGDVVLGLISGGTSAHLTAPVPGIPLEELIEVTSAAMRSGATIRELNAMRKHAETLKGGRLAVLCRPARVEALVLSDVLGDALDTIGSGPLSPDPSTYEQALRVLERRGLLGVSPSLTDHLLRGGAETPKPGAAVFEHVNHRVIASNAVAVDAACTACSKLGFEVGHRRIGIEGEAAEVGARFARDLLAAQGRGVDTAVVWGGETAVTVGNATGRGGRMTETALAAAVEIEGRSGVRVICLATDGIDGPTDAAGAAVDGDTAAAIRAANIDLGVALSRHDSYTALERAGGLIRTGPTGTNVNDVMIGLARRV